jgi:hypothetical protein
MSDCDLDNYDSDDFELDESFFIKDDDIDANINEKSYISLEDIENNLKDTLIINNFIDSIELYNSINKCINYDIKPPLCILEKKDNFKSLNEIIKKLCKKIM